MSEHFFVVTGGLGAGKTSQITELARRGFHTVPESGRAIIREEIASGGAPSLGEIAWPMPRGCLNATCAPTASHRRSQAS